MLDATPFKHLIALLLFMSIISCSAQKASDYQSQALQSREQVKPWQYTQNDATKATTLTQLIEIPQLTEFIHQAMDNNPSLQQTAIALQIVYAQRSVEASEGLPQSSLGTNSSKDEGSNTTYNSELSISWEVDLWQRISDSIKGADMDIASSQADLQAAKDALAASIMRTWLQINLQQQLISIESQRLASLEHNETFIIERYRSGLGSLEDLDDARSSSASTRATLAQYQELYAQYQRTLWQLLGQDNNQSNATIGAEFPTVLQPLASLPNQDLGRRPDLQSAYYTIYAEQYRSSAAYKALLPSLNLSAQLTGEALFNSPAWSLLGQLTAPLFNGGKLRSQADIAELTAEQAYWRYKETLLTAVNEVENALGQEQSLSRQQSHINDALQSAQRSFANYQTKYRQGLVNIIDLLSIQQQTFDLQSQLTQLIYDRLVNRIDLGLALGLGISK
ncbi:TolC family protein [Shewanella surugensis]|uniref:TolC family protein n=1 Tax=Shewanella surugensis TaxID=212020 RepID=A0ABT0LFS2_9GAMM|nr:TolC family protein [Shewanella surugensis]MCL1126566.1 TolC family protein [Shewanella surugensis]